MCSSHLDCTLQQHLANKLECSAHNMADLQNWLTHQLHTAASAGTTPDMSRDQDMPQAGNTAAPQGTYLKLHMHDRKTRVGEHELRLLAAQYHFNWQLAESKYEALRRSYVTLGQLCQQQQLELDSQVCQSCGLGCQGWKSMEDSLAVSQNSLQLWSQGECSPQVCSLAAL
jgi:hypothetical protein